MGGGCSGGPPPKRPRPQKPLAELAVTVWLTPENATFERKNGLLYLTLNGERTRVTLCREFPFELPWAYISVLNAEGEELGIIRSTDLYSGDARQLIEDELRLRYYAPQIVRILRVRERYGFSYWTVQTADVGRVTFTLQDTSRSIYRIGERSLTFADVDGNRYEISDLTALDKVSRKRLELYI